MTYNEIVEEFIKLDTIIKRCKKVYRTTQLDDFIHSLEMYCLEIDQHVSAYCPTLDQAAKVVTKAKQLCIKMKTKYGHLM